VAEDILTAVPRFLLQQVRQHLARLQEFNAGMARMRTLEQRLGSPGRYKWEFRLQREPQVQESVAWLDRFTALARTNGVDPDAVFAALGGRPALEAWSLAAQAWRREGPPSAPVSDTPEP
jgi:hypothetical protein